MSSKKNTRAIVDSSDDDSDLDSKKNTMEYDTEEPSNTEEPQSHNKDEATATSTLADDRTEEPQDGKEDGLENTVIDVTTEASVISSSQLTGTTSTVNETSQQVASASTTDPNSAVMAMLSKIPAAQLAALLQGLTQQNDNASALPKVPLSDPMSNLTSSKSPPDNESKSKAAADNTEKDDTTTGFSSPMFGNDKKRKVFTLDSDDDEEGEDTINLGQLSFLKPTKSGNPAARIIRVCTNTEGGMNGFVIYLEGWNDKVLGDIIITRSTNSANMRFLKCVGPPAFRMCHVLLPNPPEDDPNRCRKNDKKYPYKALAFVSVAGHMPTDDEVKTWYNESFYPAYVKLNEDTIRDSQWPHLPEGETEVYSNWRSVLRQEDFNWVYLAHAEQNDTKSGQNKWLIKKKAHLYSVYAPGKVPMKLLKQVNKEFLEPADAQRYANGLP
jgi:hypothetical protein